MTPSLAPAAQLTLTGQLRSALAVLERVGCQFWACPGPDAPHEDMMTCYVCAEIAALRAVTPGAAHIVHRETTP